MQKIISFWLNMVNQLIRIRVDEIYNKRNPNVKEIDPSVQLQNIKKSYKVIIKVHRVKPVRGYSSSLHEIVK